MTAIDLTDLETRVSGMIKIGNHSQALMAVKMSIEDTKKGTKLDYATESKYADLFKQVAEAQAKVNGYSATVEAIELCYEVQPTLVHALMLARALAETPDGVDRSYRLLSNIQTEINIKPEGGESWQTYHLGEVIREAIRPMLEEGAFGEIKEQLRFKNFLICIGYERRVTPSSTANTLVQDREKCVLIGPGC